MSRFANASSKWKLNWEINVFCCRIIDPLSNITLPLPELPFQLHTIVKTIFICYSDIYLALDFCTHKYIKEHIIISKAIIYGNSVIRWITYTDIRIGKILGSMIRRIL